MDIRDEAKEKRDALLKSIEADPEYGGKTGEIYKHVKKDFVKAYSSAGKRDAATGTSGLYSVSDKYNSDIKKIYTLFNGSGGAISSRLWAPKKKDGALYPNENFFSRGFSDDDINFTTGSNFELKLEKARQTLSKAELYMAELKRQEVVLKQLRGKEGLAKIVEPSILILTNDKGLKVSLQKVIDRLTTMISFMQKYQSLKDALITAAALDAASRADSPFDTGTAFADAKDAAARRSGALSSLDAKIAGAFDETVNLAFREQCFIQRYIYPLTENRIKHLDATTKLPYEEGFSSGFNRPLVVQGRAFGFMNDLVTPRSTKTLFNIPSAVLSQLQPYIRLYKVDEVGNEIPIEFESSILKNPRRDIDQILKTSKRRGQGVGLKSFDFTYEGSDPFAVKKSITAKLTIAAASFEELLEKRKSENGSYMYADLALKTGSKFLDQKINSDINSDGVIDNLDKLKFRLKAVVGYSLPPNLHIPSSPNFDRESINECLYNSFVTLHLTPTIHEFKFDDTGRVNFTCNYLAYIEDFFDNAYYNIFSDIRTTSNVYRRKVLRKYYENNCMFKKIDELKKTEEKLIPIEQRAALRSLIERLLGDNRIYALDVAYDKLGDFVLDPLVDLSTLVKKAGPATTTSVKDAAKAAVKSSTVDTSTTKIGSDYVPEPNRNEQITFFYMYDLIEIAMNNIENSLCESGYQDVLEKMKGPDKKFIAREKKQIQEMRKNFQKLRVVLGPLEITNPVNTSTYREISIADIPISLRYFSEWMTQKVISRDRVEYNLSRFVNDFVKSYLRNFLNDDTCYGGASKQRIAFYSSNVTSYKDNKSSDDEITERIKKDRISFGPEDLGRLITSSPGVLSVDSDCLLNTMGRRDNPNSNHANKNQTHFMIFYGGRAAPKDQMNGIRSADENSGIYHYAIGRDRGIIKNISLRKTEAPHLKELRFEQEGFDGLQQLREVYNAEIKTFAYPNAYPGTYIFIEPRGFAPETSKMLGAPDDAITSLNKYDLTKYGIGGYHMIIKSTHSFAEGLAETSITARWVAETNTDDAADGGSTSMTSSSSSVAKCRTKHKKDNSNKPGHSTGPKDTITTPPS